MRWNKPNLPSASVSVRRLAFPDVHATWDVVSLESLHDGDAILLYSGEPDPVTGVVIAVDGMERVVRVDAGPRH